MDKIKAFLKSPHHAWLALLALGGGLATANPAAMVGGAAAYALGWIYLPDSRLLKAWRAKRAKKRGDAEREARAGAARAARNAIYRTLDGDAREEYDRLTEVAGEIVTKLRADDADTLLPAEERIASVRRLMLAYLRLLKTEGAQRDLIRREKRDDLAEDIEELRGDIEELDAEVAELEAGGKHTLALSRRRLLDSKRERLEAAHARAERVEATRANLELAEAERERIAEVLKLARADLLSTGDAAEFGHRIDFGTRELRRTNDWLETIPESSPGATTWADEAGFEVER